MDRKDVLLQNNRVLYYRKAFVTVVVLIFIAAGSGWVIGCGTETDLSECPDTSFSQANLDTLEAQNPKFVWRVCNEDADHPMENIVIENYNTNDLDSLMVGDVTQCKCSKYYPGTFEGDRPIEIMLYEQRGEDYKHGYLGSYSPATRGLAEGDSISILSTPGRYTYHFFRDTTTLFLNWVEVELEAYH